MSQSESSVTANEDILKVTIHYCENLKPSILLLQPVLCMHVIDAKSGTYFKKSDRNRAVVSYYENQRDDIDYIMPVMTQPCSVSGEKLTLLNWDETFILNERYDIFLRKDSNIILFFEIVDLISISRTKHQYQRLNHNGMYKLAWAFLKIIGCNGSVNTGSKLRLQLYKPGKHRKKIRVVEVYDWWLKKSRTPMDASLYISIEPHATFVAKPALRSMLPTQKEKGSTTFEKLAGLDKEASLDFTEESHSVSVDGTAAEVIWSRIPGEPCKIPQKKALLLDILNCCHILKFSSSGRILVAGCGARDCYYLMFYQVPQGNQLHKMLAHSERIYDVDWSYNDNYLLSASGDYNVKMWDMKSWNLVSTFVHPSFVYCVKFHPTSDNILATACCDHIVRIWTVEKCHLLNDLESHSSSVYTLCWNQSGTKLYSADGIGQIKVWTRSKLVKGESYQLKNEITPEETTGIAINKMVLDLNEETACLFCSDSVTRILDLVNGNILSSYESDISSPNFSRGCCSPCGNLLFLCYDKGTVSVWDKTSSKKCVESISYNLNYGDPSCIEYHPHDHILALSFWDEGVPIHIYFNEETDEGRTETVANTLDVKVSKSGKTPSHVNRLSSISKKSYKLTARTADNIKRNNKPEMPLSAGTSFAIRKDTTKKVFEGTSGTYKSHKPEEISLSDALRNKFQEKCKEESLTAVITKSGQFDVIAVADDSMNSESNIFRSEEPVIPNRSSKRSQRRKKLRELNKALL